MKPQAKAEAPPCAPKSTPSHALNLLDDGYLILPNLLTRAEVRRIAAELEPHFDATPKCEGDFYGWKTTRLGCLLTDAPSTQALVLHEAVWPIVEPILKPACDYVQLNLVQGVRIHPGERGQAPHRDEEMWPCDKQGVPWLVNVMWAIDDFTDENGATRLWPGSHKGALDRYLDPKASIPAVMPAGSACLFMGALTHCGGANRSARPRTGIIVSYCLGWLKQYENQFLAYPPSAARNFPPAIQALIGYRIHAPNLGGWRGRDPSLLLDAPGAGMPFVDALPPAIAEELRAYYASGAPAAA